MAIQTFQKQGKTIWVRSGAASFYARYNSYDPIRSIDKIGYTDKKIISHLPLLEPLDSLRFDDQNNEIRKPLPAFLLTLYRKGFDLTSTKIVFDLDKDIENGGLASEYGDIKLLEILILTGTKQKTFQKKDGTVVDLRKYNPGDPLPEIIEVPDLNKSKLISLVKHLGLKGLVPYLFVEGIIDFDTFKLLFKYFFPKKIEKRAYYRTRLRAFLRNKRMEVFSEEEFKALEII